MPPAGPTGEFAEIAARIKEVRTHLGLTQEEFAEAIGVTRSHLADIETHRIEPSLRAIKGVMRMDLVLGPLARPIDCRWLFFGDGKMFAEKRKGFWDPNEKAVALGPDAPEYRRRFYPTPGKPLVEDGGN